MDTTSTDDFDISYLPSGDACEKCNSTRDVQKFDGKMLCKSCRSQWQSIS